MIPLPGPSGRGSEFTQPSLHLLAEYSISQHFGHLFGPLHVVECADDLDHLLEVHRSVAVLVVHLESPSEDITERVRERTPRENTVFVSSGTPD